MQSGMFALFINLDYESIEKLNEHSDSCITQEEIGRRQIDDIKNLSERVILRQLEQLVRDYRSLMKELSGEFPKENAEEWGRVSNK